MLAHAYNAQYVPIVLYMLTTVHDGIQIAYSSMCVYTFCELALTVNFHDGIKAYDDMCQGGQAASSEGWKVGVVATPNGGAPHYSTVLYCTVHALVPRVLWHSLSYSNLRSNCMQIGCSRYDRLYRIL